MSETPKTQERPTIREIVERQRFRRDDPIWQLIGAVTNWASWAYSEEGPNRVLDERIERSWALVEEKEAALRVLLEEVHS